MADQDREVQGAQDQKEDFTEEDPREKTGVGADQGAGEESLSNFQYFCCFFRAVFLTDFIQKNTITPIIFEAQETPAMHTGKINILEIKAARVEYATQLNHL